MFTKLVGGAASAARGPEAAPMDARATAVQRGSAGGGLRCDSAAWRPRRPPPAGAESGERINLAGIDFVSLRLMVLCAELGSLSSAAKQANMSLSCASHRLSTAEDLFGARLFERDHRGLHPTEAGTSFVGHARAILELMRRALRDVRPAGARTEAAVAASPGAWSSGG